jgi:MFS family permease
MISHGFVSSCLFFFIGSILMTIVQLLILMFAQSLNLLPLCSILIGFTYGLLFAVSPALVSSYFGLQQFSTNWGWLVWAPALGGQILNLIFGIIYDSDPTCLSFTCFNLSFLSLNN